MSHGDRDKASEEAVYRLGLAVVMVESVLEQLRRHDIDVESMKILGLDGSRGDLLLVVTALGADGRIVAFRNGADVGSVLKSFVNAARNGSLKWKVDQYGNTG